MTTEEEHFYFLLAMCCWIAYVVIINYLSTNHMINSENKLKTIHLMEVKQLKKYNKLKHHYSN